MGAVYAARDLDAQVLRLVALKTTKRSGVEAERLLQDEARIASQIDHQNVCRVHEYDRQHETQYLVLDYCDGTSLHELLLARPRHRLPTPVAVKIVAQVAAGLHAAHELRGSRGQLLRVVHRDVSPQNILISSKGRVSLTDFGVAKALGQVHRPTETGEVKGKTSYMAPEQIRSRDLDRRVDIFALACVLYQALLGRRPFAGDSAVSTMYQILEEDLMAPSALEPDFPASLENILLRALEKDRTLRHATAEDFQVALETWLVDHGHLITEREIERTLMETLGPSIDERKGEVLRRARLEPRDGEDDTEAQDRPSGAKAVREVDSTPPATAFADSKRRVGRSPWLLAALGLTALGVTLATVLGIERPTSGPTEVATSAPLNGAHPSEIDSGVSSERPPIRDSGTPTGPESKDEVPKVSVAIETKPLQATISVDGEERGTGKVEYRTPSTKEPRRVLAVLDGYVPAERVIDFSQDRSLFLELEPVDRPPPQRAVPRPMPVPRERPAPSPKPPTNNRRLNERTLDQDNPFDD